MADNLTHDMIEKILSKLPVASLLRFKAVSTEWNTMISDPRFIRTHNPDSQNVILTKLQGSTWSAACLVRLEDGKLQIEKMLQKTDEGDIMCIDNGMVLLWSKAYRDHKHYLLWNPSTRQKTLIRFPYNVNPYLYPYYTREHCSHPLMRRYPYIWGLCPDPSNDDYKVVIVYKNLYAVFSCKNQSWSPRKEYPFYVITYSFHWGEGLSVDGAIYWYLDSEIVCFDPKDENFKILNKPEELKVNVELMCFKGCLCLCCEGEEETIARFWIKEKGTYNNSWKVLMSVKELPEPFNMLKQLMFFEENKILIRTIYETYFVYDPTLKSYKESKCIDEVFGRMFPYRESLFFPTYLKE